MALILSIDTATENAIVSIGDESAIIATESNKDQMNHASFVQPAIEKLMLENNLSFDQIDAIAVSAGPGSYTGLRVGLSSAKGLCFALDKPLILLNTLQVMAAQATLELNNANILYCPMIDARRTEVFTAVYDFSLQEILPANHHILTNEGFLDTLLSYNKEILFFGSGAVKFQSLTQEKNYSFSDIDLLQPKGINQLAQQSFNNKSFADLAYSEPFYFKEFYTTAKING